MLFKKGKIKIGDLTIKTYELFNICIFEKRIDSLDGWKEYSLFGIPVYNSNGLKKKRIVENFVPKKDSSPGKNGKERYPKIGILIEWSDEACFFDTLNSICKQSYRNFEIVVSRRAKTQMKQFSFEHDVCVVYYDGDNILDGVKNTIGEYIAFCESGDIFTCDNLSSRIDALVRYEYPAVVFNDAMVSGNDFYSDLVNRKLEENRKLLNKRINDLSDEQWRKRNYLFALSCLLVRKEELLSCNFDSPVALLSDWWILRQICVRNEILMLPEKLVNLKISVKRVSKLNIHQMYRELLVSKADFLSGYRSKSDLEFGENSVNLKLSVGKLSFENGRVAVFASFNSKGIVDDYVVYYLRELRKVVDGIVFICDNPVFPEEIKKIEPYVFYIECERHGEYDFGSYKRGINYLFENHLVDSLNELILCNDSCYGPIFPFLKLFLMMQTRKKNVDFWGISKNSVIKDHIQSFFIVFGKRILMDSEFRNFFSFVKKHDDIIEVILNYEIELTNFFEKRGYSYDTVVDFSLTGARSLELDYASLGIPLIKRKAVDGTYNGKKKKVSKLLNWIKKENFQLFSIIDKK